MTLLYLGIENVFEVLSINYGLHEKILYAQAPKQAIALLGKEQQIDGFVINQETLHDSLNNENPDQYSLYGSFDHVFKQLGLEIKEDPVEAYNQIMEVYSGLGEQIRYLQRQEVSEQDKRITGLREKRAVLNTCSNLLIDEDGGYVFIDHLIEQNVGLPVYLIVKNQTVSHSEGSLPALAAICEPLIKIGTLHGQYETRMENLTAAEAQVLQYVKDAQPMALLQIPSTPIMISHERIGPRSFKHWYETYVQK